MKMFFIMLSICFGLAFFAFCGIFSSRNSAVSLEETVNSAKSGIDVQLGNRFQKLHELAACVKRYDEHEYKTLVDVIDRRGKNMSGADLKACLAKFDAVAEQYPQLRSADNYGRLMTDISLTENLLAQKKDAFNKSVREYKYQCKKFPTCAFLNMTGYQVKDFKYYEASAEIKDTDNKKLDLFN